jgi:hypothetical protein
MWKFGHVHRLSAAQDQTDYAGAPMGVAPLMRGPFSYGGVVD